MTERQRIIRNADGRYVLDAKGLTLNRCIIDHEMSVYFEDTIEYFCLTCMNEFSIRAADGVEVIHDPEAIIDAQNLISLLGQDLQEIRFGDTEPLIIDFINGACLTVLLDRQYESWTITLGELLFVGSPHGYDRKPD